MQTEAIAYVALPGELIQLQKLSGIANISNVKTSRSDFDIIKTSDSVDLRSRHSGWVWNTQKQNELRVALFGCAFQFYPEIEDYVIVVIQGKSAENYFCSLGSGSSYVLNGLDFEGATKKNRPNLQIGSLVYARVLETSGCLRGRLSCVNPKSKKEWITGESLFGQLIEGLCIDVPLHFSEFLLSKQKKPALFKELSKHTTFEVCIGRNGKIWIKSESDDNTLLLCNLIKKASDMHESDQLNLIQQCGAMFNR